MEVKAVCVTVDKLEQRINEMQKALIQIAAETGLGSDDTLCYSQRLDEYITMYQKLKMGPKGIMNSPK